MASGYIMKNLSIRWKISVFASTCTLLAMLALGGMSAHFSSVKQSLVSEQTTENIKASTLEYVSAVTSDQVQKIKVYLIRIYNEQKR